MKRILLTVLGFGFNAYALSPTPGVYGGVIVGGSYSLPINAGFAGQNLSTYFGLPLGAYKGELKYSILGLVGGQLGYRFDKTRIEAEFFYNSNPYSSFTLYTNNQPFFQFSGNSSDAAGNYIDGNTNTAAGMLNLYYDLLPPDNIDSYFAPFIGIGGGYAAVQNNLNIYFEGSPLNQQALGKTRSSFGGQVMAGVLMFLDDFSYFSLDFRYFTTTSASEYIPSTQQTVSWNNQIISLNLSFNGTFNLG